MDYKKWGLNNSLFIYKSLDADQYYDVFRKFNDDFHLSSVKGAAFFGVSRRSYGRYLSKKRDIPMGIINTILKVTGIEYKGHERIAFDEFDENGAFLWYGNKNVLFNTLYAYRTKQFNWSRFEAACKLNIKEEVLLGYENGTKKISLTDQDNILQVYHITIPELYPTLLSYDGGQTYLPLNLVYDLTFKEKTFDLAEGELYAVKDDVICVMTWPEFPIYRYDSKASPMYRCIQDEMTLDEYINTDWLILNGGDWDYEVKDLTKYKLPPVYKFLMKPPKERRARVKSIKKVGRLEFNKDYTVFVYGTSSGRGNKFDLKGYVFSDSIWYNQLQDPEYFASGKLTYIGDCTLQNQCILWENGQYIRIIELYMEKNPNINYGKKIGTGINERYEWSFYDAE